MGMMTPGTILRTRPQEGAETAGTGLELEGFGEYISALQSPRGLDENKQLSFSYKFY